MTKPPHRTSTNRVTEKLNNNVRKAIAAATIQAADIPAFNHFSYQADWSNFPNSLIISCVFNNVVLQNDIQQPTSPSLLESQLSKLLQLSLLKQGIKFRDFRNNIKVITLPAS